jgi:formiminotetrahydrofolate cyclodeaminase
MTESVGGMSLRGLLDAVGARTSAPGGGAVAGVVASLAGALCSMCARFSDADHGDLAGRADELADRAAYLAQSDLAVFATYVRARRAGRTGEVAAGFEQTIRVPLEIAAVAAELAGLAADLARSGNPNLRGDAIAAVLIGSAAARAAAVLVCENLDGTGGDPRLARAAALVASVSTAERDALSLYPALTTS